MSYNKRIVAKSMVTSIEYAFSNFLTKGKCYSKNTVNYIQSADTCTPIAYVRVFLKMCHQRATDVSRMFHLFLLIRAA